MKLKMKNKRELDAWTKFVTVQSGWVNAVVNGEHVRYARMVSIPWVFDKSVVCGYARRAEDQACAHCWRSKA